MKKQRRIIFAAIVVALLGPNQRALIRWVSLVASVGTIALALLLAGRLMAVQRTVPMPT